MVPMVLPALLVTSALLLSPATLAAAPVAAPVLAAATGPEVAQGGTPERAFAAQSPSPNPGPTQPAGPTGGVSRWQAAIVAVAAAAALVWLISRLGGVGRGRRQR